ncbi:hemolysin-III channel protein [Ceratobasidium sp. AG-Ba]|nr:hemolysin-III channel protein [Ceratobasidium sp. AG-Ba]
MPSPAVKRISRTSLVHSCTLISYPLTSKSPRLHDSTMETPRRVPGARRLSSPPIMHTYRPPNTRARTSHTLRRRTARPIQPISRAVLKSLAPLNLDIPSPSQEPATATETSLYLLVLSHLTDLEARLHSSASSSALEVLHKLRDEVAAFFPSPTPAISIASPTDGPSSDEYDFEYDFGISSALALDLDLNLNLRARYDELANLSLDEAKNKLAALSALGYDDAKSRFDALSLRLGDAKDRLVKWADETVPSLSTLTIPDLPTLPHLPDLPALPIDLPVLPLPDLHARLDELRAALPADLSSATDRLVSFVEGLIEDDADGDVSWVETRWKGLNMSGGLKEKVAGWKEEVDMHGLALKLSEGGKRLIRYCDLPEKWRNNEFVDGGYRFIPSAKWPRLVWSAFEIHNETMNIHTHLIPLLAMLSVLPVLFTELAQGWEFESDKFASIYSIISLPEVSFPTFPTISGFSWLNITLPSLPFDPLPPSPADALPKSLFLLAASACLACSTAWHTLAGCSDLWWLEAV